MLIILLVVVLIIIAAIFIAKYVGKFTGTPEVPEDQEIIYSLPDTTYSDMIVVNIQMEYLKDQDKTMLSMVINNVTTEKVVDDHFNAILIGPDETVLGQMPTWIQELNAGEQYAVEVILSGDLTATQQIKLVKK